MNYKLKIGFLALVGAIAITSCKKEDPQPTEPIVTTPNASLSDLRNYLKSNLDAAAQTFTVNEDAGQTITGAKGTVVIISPNSFQTQSGGAVTGNITVKLTEIFDKKDMILMNAATMGRNWDGSLKPLISGGEFKITAYQNGQALKLKPGMQIQATVPASNGVDPSMGLFYGEGGENPDTLVWNQADSALFGGQGNQYTFWSDSLNWINCDYFYNDPNPQTIVQVTPPAGFDNSNMLLFISFDGMTSISSIYNFAAGNFTTAPSYTLPIGMNVHFVAIAMIGGNPHVAIVPATLANNHLEVIPALTQMTPAQLATALNALP
jgi:hypothetical protein